MEELLGNLWTRLTGLNLEEALVASSHFHAFAFWSTVPALLALLLGRKWIAYLSLPWGLTVIIAEWGHDGRWVDVITRAGGCAAGFVFGLWVLLRRR